MFESINSVYKYKLFILLYFINLLLANVVVKSETIIIDTLEDIQSSQSPIQSLCNSGYKTSSDFECEGSFAIPGEDQQIDSTGFWSGCDMGSEVCEFTYTKQKTTPVSILIKAYFKGDTKINIEIQPGVTESIKGNNEWLSKVIEVSNFESIDSIRVTPGYESSDVFVIIDQFIFEFDDPTPTTPETTTIPTTTAPTTPETTITTPTTPETTTTPTTTATTPETTITTPTTPETTTTPTTTAPTTLETTITTPTTPETTTTPTTTPETTTTPTTTATTPETTITTPTTPETTTTLTTTAPTTPETTITTPTTPKTTTTPTTTAPTTLETTITTPTTLETTTTPTTTAPNTPETTTTPTTTAPTTPETTITTPTTPKTTTLTTPETTTPTTITPTTTETTTPTTITPTTPETTTPTKTAPTTTVMTTTPTETTTTPTTTETTTEPETPTADDSTTLEVPEPTDATNTASTSTKPPNTNRPSSNSPNTETTTETEETIWTTEPIYTDTTIPPSSKTSFWRLSNPIVILGFIVAPVTFAAVAVSACMYYCFKRRRIQNGRMKKTDIENDPYQNPKGNPNARIGPTNSNNPTALPLTRTTTTAIPYNFKKPEPTGGVLRERPERITTAEAINLSPKLPKSSTSAEPIYSEASPSSVYGYGAGQQFFPRLTRRGNNL